MDLDPQNDGDPDPKFENPDMDVRELDAMGTVRILATNSFFHKTDPDPGLFKIQ